MFTMTPQALAVVRQVTAHPLIGRTSGLRIAGPGAGRETLDVGTAAAPEPGDEIVEHDGGKVFLDETAVSRVRGRILDAVTERTGRVQFVVRA